ncbi:MAG: ParB/RepB/Spo0J family partition protein [Betaproteobacteria bacterium]|nr:ParB/RepB/Spo0J family partition protein [Betaproteobacteria bacterium]
MKLKTAYVIPNPDQPRKRFNPESLAELAASIKANGLIQPITVRLFAPYSRCALVGDPRDAMPRYMIVAGERRWRAHVLAGLDTIDANLIDITDGERDILAIVENLQRADITPLEEGRAFQRVLDTGVTAEELAHRLGLKQAWRITERTALLRLNRPYLDLLEKGHLSPSQGTELARLEPSDQDALFRLIRDGRCDTYAKLRAAADALLAAASQGGFFEKPKASAAEAKALTAFEAKIEQIVRLIASGFKDNEVVALKKINPHRAGIVAAQIELISKHLKLIEREIQKAAIQSEIAA